MEEKDKNRRTKRNNFVGKMTESYRNVGSNAIGLRIDPEFLDAVRDNPFRGLEKPRYPRHIDLRKGPRQHSSGCGRFS